MVPLMFGPLNSIAAWGSGNAAHYDAHQERFSEIVEAAIDGRLDQVEIEWDRRSALGVVVAARGYPMKPEKVL